MLYAIYVGAGKEKSVETCIKNTFSREMNKGSSASKGSSMRGLCTSCFYPVRHMRKKIRGNWVDYYERLIPGYIFAESEDILRLYEELFKLPFFMKILGKDEQKDSAMFQALQTDEVRWLQAIMGNRPERKTTDEQPVVELSQVCFDENDQVKILSGPLTSMTGMIRKINVHRRVAEVEVELMGRKIPVHLGIELLGRKG